MATQRFPGPVVFRDVISRTEDVYRQPDGVPHIVIALTVLASALFAFAVGGFIATARPGWVGASMLAALGIGVLFVIRRRIHRGRDRVHPSR